MLDDPDAGEGRQRGSGLVSAVIVGDEEAVDPERPVMGQPFQDIGSFVLENGGGGEAARRLPDRLMPPAPASKAIKSFPLSGLRAEI